MEFWDRSQKQVVHQLLFEALVKRAGSSTQTSLANAVGCDPSTISRWKRLRGRTAREFEDPRKFEYLNLLIQHLHLGYDAADAMLWISGNELINQSEGTQHFGVEFMYQSKDQGQRQGEAAGLVEKLVQGGFLEWRMLEREFEDARVEVPEEILSRRTTNEAAQTRLSAQVESIYLSSGRYLAGRRSADFHQLDNFLESNPSGHLLVTGDAGIGKSTLLAHWTRVHKNDWFIASRFFSKEDGTEEVSEGLSQVAEDLRRFLEIASEPIDRTNLSRIKDTVHDLLLLERRPAKLVVPLDGLDEAKESSSRGGFPRLKYMLPPELPKDTYVILGARTRDEEATKEYYARGLALEEEQIKEYRLEPLDEEDVIDILQHNPKFKTLQQLASDSEFCQKLARRTSG